ncbi:MAG: TIGR02757 family protein [Proteobacteria bacterium]|nr:TIGR02757 family protein [Pseudomonadota bacterium]
MAQFNPDLALILEKAYRDFHLVAHRNQDPIRLVYQYEEPKDQELAAFLTALLAYGSVSTIISSVKKVLSPLGKNPHAFLKSAPLKGLWSGFYHRFTTGEDIEIVMHRLQSILRRHESIEDFFLKGGSQQPMRELLSSFVNRFEAEPLPVSLRKTAERRSRNLKYLISDPARGSACKRLNLFLRWVVRPKDGIDLGLWKNLSPKQLILPVDTHLLQILKRLRWTRSDQATWKVAELATENLRFFCPEDPIRYDFALCHLSMSGHSLQIPKLRGKSHA